MNASHTMVRLWLCQDQPVICHLYFFSHFFCNMACAGCKLSVLEYCHTVCNISMTKSQHVSNTLNYQGCKIPHILLFPTSSSYLIQIFIIGLVLSFVICLILSQALAHKHQLTLLLKQICGFHESYITFVICQHPRRLWLPLIVWKDMFLMFSISSDSQ